MPLAWLSKSGRSAWRWLLGNGLAAMVALILAVLGLALCASWGWLREGSEESKSATLRNLALIGVATGGAVALWLNWRRTENDGKRLDNEAKRLGQDRQRLANETYVKAIDQLGRAEETIRIGGIYALERIAQEDIERYHWPVMETLSAFTRATPANEGEAREGSDEACEPTASAKPSTDIQATLTVIGRRNDTQRELETKRGWRIDLSHARLEGADLCGVHLEYTNFACAHLEGANLYGAHLEKANLSGAHLEGALLAEEYLSGAFLRGVHGLTQEMLDRAAWRDHEGEPLKSPLLDGAYCAKTGEPLVWNYPPVGDGGNFRQI